MEEGESTLSQNTLPERTLPVVKEEGTGVISKCVSLAKRLWTFLLMCMNNVTIEPIMFFHGAAYSCVDLVNTSLTLDKICQVGTTWFSNGTTYPAEICESLDNGDYEDIQNSVQSAYSKLKIASGYFGRVPSFIMVFVMGAMADKKGRKFVLYFTIVSLMCDMLFFLVQSIFFHEIGANSIMFEDFGNVFGGSTSFFMASYAYAADVSSTDFRFGRLAVLDIFYTLSQTIFSGMSGYLLKYLGYVGVYCVGFGWSLLAMLYLIFFVKESMILNKDPISQTVQPRASRLGQILTSLKGSFSDIWRVLRTKRPHGLRSIIWLYIFLYFLRLLSDGSARPNLEIIYQKKVLQWDSVEQYNLFYSKLLSASYLVQTIILILAPFIIRLNIFKDCWINILNTFTSFVSKFFYIIAWAPVAFYIAEIVNSPNALKHMAFRSHLSKLVPASDTGKIFSIIAFIQSCMGFIKAIWFAIYDATLDFHPAYIHCIGATLTLVTLAGLFYILIKTNKIERLEETKKEGSRISVISNTASI